MIFRLHHKRVAAKNRRHDSLCLLSRFALYPLPIQQLVIISKQQATFSLWEEEQTLDLLALGSNSTSWEAMYVCRTQTSVLRHA